MFEKLYHTVEDRGDPEHIENYGPFKCKRKDAWLGDGYYFWENYIDNAHWWGKHSYNDNYVICYTESDYKQNDCLDLTNSSVLEDFKEIINIACRKNIINKNATIPAIIEKLQNSNSFPYKIIKIRSEYTKTFNPENARKFNKNQQQFIDFSPPIQICFKDKPSIKIKRFKIIFPLKYVDGYAV
ncbi:MAG: hypothetical protein LBL79_05450 [Prevotella sp.]|jgi:membrane-anchored protein YejM (alkaline phosphatase superfamily)|nr:hypothetical protein [Prevotella sp.]